MTFFPLWNTEDNIYRNIFICVRAMEGSASQYWLVNSMFFVFCRKKKVKKV